MARSKRLDIGGLPYHIINRANARLPIFFKEKDYLLFEEVLLQAVDKYNMRLLAYTLMPNHFHLVVYPRKDGEIQKFMQWLTLTHTQRWHAANKSIGTGHLYQGRYKSFVIKDDHHLLTVLRYVERNPVRAKLVKKASNWPFSSFFHRTVNDKLAQETLSPWPIATPTDYTSWINTPLTGSELESLRTAVNKGKPYGSDTWIDKIVKKYELEGTMRERGRPKKGT